MVKQSKRNFSQYKKNQSTDDEQDLKNKKPKLEIKKNVQLVEENDENEYNNLPINKEKDSILQEIINCSAYILCSTTGSGKTTQIPKLIFYNKLNKNKMIGITQPRRLATISSATRVAEEMKTKLGGKVGYSIRFEHRCNDSTKIKFMTDGILLRESVNDSELSNYSFIILDEAHERSVNTEVLFGVVQNAQKLRSKTSDPLKVIIMSATISLKEFEDYFVKHQVSVISRFLETPLHPLSLYGMENKVEDYVRKSAASLTHMHMAAFEIDYMPDFKDNLSYGVLIFLTGEAEIQRCCELLEMTSGQLIEEGYGGFNVFPLYSALSSELQNAAVTGSSDLTKRTVVVATNIAETSLTIPGIRVVIDCCKSKQKFINSQTGVESLKVCWISKAQAEQRAGRARRQGPGVTHRLITNEEYLKEMPNFQPSSLEHCSLLGTVLEVVGLGFKNVEKNFPWLQAPTKMQLDGALTHLSQLGAVEKFEDDIGVKITELGRKLLSFPLDPRLAKVLLESTKQNQLCLAEAVQVVAMLNVVDKLFRREVFDGAEDDHAGDDADDSLTNYSGDLSNMVVLFRAYTKLRSDNDRVKFCNRNGLQLREMCRAYHIAAQLRDVCHSLKMQFASCHDKYVKLLNCFLAAFPNNVAQLLPAPIRRDSNKKRLPGYPNARAGLYSFPKMAEAQNITDTKSELPVYVHPSSVLARLNAPTQQLFFIERVHTENSKIHLRHLQRIPYNHLS